MNRTLLGIVGLTAILTFELRPAIAQNATVESHAYLYITQEMNNGRNPVVVIEQPDTVRFVGCHLSEGESVPTTSTELTTLLSKPSCLILVDGQLNTPGIDWKTKLVHQRLSDRYVAIANQIQAFPHGTPMPVGGGNFPDAVITVSSGFTFEKKDKSVLNLTFTYIIYDDGKNPQITTKRMTALKQYDAAVSYPEILEKPVEQ